MCACVCVCLSSLFLCVFLWALLLEIKAWLIDWYAIQETLLPQTDHATRCVSENLANWPVGSWWLNICNHTSHSLRTVILAAVLVKGRTSAATYRIKLSISITRWLFPIQGGPKTGLFFRLDNFVTVSPRKACSMSKFSQFYREKGTKLAFQWLNIICQICSNHYNSWNYAIYDQNTRILINLH